MTDPEERQDTDAKRKDRDPREPGRRPPDDDESREEQRDKVDEASWESFPASDPPATNAGSISKDRPKEGPE